MRNNHQKSRRQQKSRKGAMVPVVAMTLPIIMIFIGFSVNIAYMELARTELRLTCDSAAKAALVNFGATQSQSTAISFGQSVSGNNKVCGQTLSIPTGNFKFGNSTKQASGVYAFTAGGTPINSVQVTGNTTLSLPSQPWSRLAVSLFQNPRMPRASVTTSSWSWIARHQCRSISAETNLTIRRVFRCLLRFNVTSRRRRQRAAGGPH